MNTNNNNNNHDRYLTPAYASPKSPYQSPIIGNSIPPAQAMGRSSSYDPHRVLGYFDIPSRSAPSSPQTSYLPYTPTSRSNSPAREARRSREFSHQNHSGSDFEDALVGFNLVPNWLKMAMEQDQPVMAGVKTTQFRQQPHSPLSSMGSPNSVLPSPNQATPMTPRTPQLNVTIPLNKDVKSPVTQEIVESSKTEDEDRRYWEEEDEGYWGEMEGDEEDLEEAYRSVQL